MMILNLQIEGEACPLEVSEEFCHENRPFFDKMDQDMDQGWQMSQRWVESPSPDERAAIVGDRLVQALKSGNGHLLTLMAGYLADRYPTAERLELYDRNDINLNRITLSQGED
jgi:hypothetical protein